MIWDILQSTSNHPCPIGAFHGKLNHTVQVQIHLLFHPLVVLGFIWVPTQTEVHWDAPFLGTSVGKRMGAPRELEAELGKRLPQMAVAYSSGDRKGLDPMTGSSQADRRQVRELPEEKEIEWVSKCVSGLWNGEFLGLTTTGLHLTPEQVTRWAETF